MARKTVGCLVSRRLGGLPGDRALLGGAAGKELVMVMVMKLGLPMPHYALLDMV